MTDGMDAATRRRRGIIVIDSSALHRLDGLVPPQMQSSKGVQDQRYCDVLRQLGRNGYDIIIPEMVAIECAQTATDGLRAANLFTMRNKADACWELIQDASLGNIEGVRIQRHDSDSQASQFCGQFRSVLENKELNKDTKRKEILRLTAQRKAQGDLGEHHAFEVIQSLDASVPIFYLNEDLNSYPEVPKAIYEKLNVLSVKGMLHALAKEQLLDKFGLKQADPNSPEEHLQAALDGSGNSSGRRASHMPNIDTSYYNVMRWVPPFAESLSGLSQEIDALEEKRRMATAERPGGSQVEKFMKKWKGKEKGSRPVGP